MSGPIVIRVSGRQRASQGLDCLAFLAVGIGIGTGSPSWLGWPAIILSLFVYATARLLENKR